MIRDADPVHVVNGDSVARTLADSTVRGPVVVWRDVLCEGPLPPGDPAAVRAARAEFLAGAGFGSVATILADLEAVDAALIAALDRGLETVLWFEHDLHDQLQLIQILARIADHPARDATRLITLDRFEGHPRFAGLGELSAGELVTLWPGRRPIAAGAFAVATRAYAALRQPDPGGLAALAGEEIPSLPYLAAAIRRLLEERPWVSGLGRSEQQILRAVAGGAHSRAEVFAETQKMEEAPYTGDDWLFRRIEELAAGGDPLLTSTADQFALTPAGRAALNA
jgi:Domain of unknown function (DUF1835)